jgi:hypothetical protein
MTRKFWIGVVVVFVVLVILDTVVNTMLMKGVYSETASLWRPEAEIKYGVIIMSWAFMAFFFTLIFSKGYQQKGVWEGVRYGLYVTGLMSIPAAYMTYATMPVPYALTFQWWVYSGITNVILGILLALIVGKKTATPAI